MATRRDLDHLVERSLVTRAGGGRYRLLETLRAFGAEQLVAGGRADDVAARHAEHQVAWIEQADEGLLEPDGTDLTDIDLAVPELRAALGWLLAHDRVEDAGRLVSAVTMYGLFRVRPDVLAWSELVGAADPEDRSPWAPRVWAAAAYAAWIVGDVAGSGARSGRALAACERTGTPIPPVVATTCGNFDLFEGRLDRAAAWYRRAIAAVGDHHGQRQVATSTELLALAYGDDPSAAAAADALVGQLDDTATVYTAYSWFCAGEAAPDDDVARARFLRALELADATAASFVIGLAGAALSAIDARVGDPRAAAEDHRRLIGLWRRSGAWSTLWTLLRAVAALLVRLERYRDAAVLEGAVRATGAGHRIFGADERALAELGRRLRTELGDDEYEAAVREGAALDGDGAVEHALRVL